MGDENIKNGPPKTLTIKLGECNENFQMHEEEYQLTTTTKMRNGDVTFAITAGPLFYQGELLLNTYVLKIFVKDPSEYQRPQVDEHAGVLHSIAFAFCEQYNFTINNHLNSFPVFQAIVIKV